MHRDLDWVDKRVQDDNDYYKRLVLSGISGTLCNRRAFGLNRDTTRLIPFALSSDHR